MAYNGFSNYITFYISACLDDARGTLDDIVKYANSELALSDEELDVYDLGVLFKDYIEGEALYSDEDFMRELAEIALEDVDWNELAEMRKGRYNIE